MAVPMPFVSVGRLMSRGVVRYVMVGGARGSKGAGRYSDSEAETEPHTAVVVVVARALCWPCVCV